VNARLKPIEQRPILRPAYDNANIAKFWKWERDNAATLWNYYIVLGGLAPREARSAVVQAGRAQRYLSFAQVQWDRERGVF
jgi:hypothetical protein